MKKTKVNLLKKIKEEAQKHRETELRQSKKISQLTKQERLKDVKIKSLETETNRFKSLLKRKEDQMLAMKKMVKPMSDKVAGRVPLSIRNNKSLSSRVPFSPKALKSKWQHIEQDISKVLINKRSIASQEFQMERFLQERAQLVSTQESIKDKIISIKKTDHDWQTLNELEDELNSIEENILFLNQNIDECQSTIMQLEEATGDVPTLDVNSILNDLTIAEVKYLFEKLLTMTINQSLLASQKEEERQEYEIKYNQLEDNSALQEHMIHFLLDTTFIENRDPTKSCEKSDKPITAQIASTEICTPGDEAQQYTKPEKARRLTKTPQELLFEQSKSPFTFGGEDLMTQSLGNTASSLAKNSDLPRTPSAPSLK